MDSLTPNSVKQAIQDPTFHQNKSQFWKMLCFLFTDYQDKKVYNHIDNITFSMIMEQLHVVMENTEEYSTIASNKNLIKHVYYAGLTQTKGHNSLTRWQATEKTTTLQAFHYIYKQLFHMKLTLPTFGKVGDDFKN
jgi:hypothetical protein